MCTVRSDALHELRLGTNLRKGVLSSCIAIGCDLMVLKSVIKLLCRVMNSVLRVVWILALLLVSRKVWTRQRWLLRNRRLAWYSLTFLVLNSNVSLMLCGALVPVCMVS